MTIEQKWFIQIDVNNRVCGLMPDFDEDIDPMTGETVVIKNNPSEPWFECEIPDALREHEFLDDFVYENGRLAFSENQERIAKETAQKERAEFFASLQDTIDSNDEAICALYEENQALNSLADEQDAAICELWEALDSEGE